MHRPTCKPADDGHLWIWIYPWISTENLWIWIWIWMNNFISTTSLEIFRYCYSIKITLIVTLLCCISEKSKSLLAMIAFLHCFFGVNFVDLWHFRVLTILFNHAILLKMYKSNERVTIYFLNVTCPTLKCQGQPPHWVHCKRGRLVKMHDAQHDRCYWEDRPPPRRDRC